MISPMIDLPKMIAIASTKVTTTSKGQPTTHHLKLIEDQMASHMKLTEMTLPISPRAVNATTLLVHPHFLIAVAGSMAHKTIPDSKELINSDNKTRST